MGVNGLQGVKRRGGVGPGMTWVALKLGGRPELKQRTTARSSRGSATLISTSSSGERSSYRPLGLSPTPPLQRRVFGRRYRRVVRGWEASMKGPPRAADRRCVSLSTRRTWPRLTTLRCFAESTGPAPLYPPFTLPCAKRLLWRSYYARWPPVQPSPASAGGSASGGVSFMLERLRCVASYE